MYIERERERDDTYIVLGILLLLVGPVLLLEALPVQHLLRLRVQRQEDLRPSIVKRL